MCISTRTGVLFAVSRTGWQSCNSVTGLCTQRCAALSDAGRNSSRCVLCVRLELHLLCVQLTCIVLEQQQGPQQASLRERRRQDRVNVDTHRCESVGGSCNCVPYIPDAVAKPNGPDNWPARTLWPVPLESLITPIDAILRVCPLIRRHLAARFVQCVFAVPPLCRSPQRCVRVDPHRCESVGGSCNCVPYTPDAVAKRNGPDNWPARTPCPAHAAVRCTVHGPEFIICCRKRLSR